MRALILRIVNLLALLAAVAWLARVPGWDSLVAALTLLATFLAQEIWPVLKGSETDRHLFERFLSEFPSTGRSVRFLEDHDIGAPFPSEDLNEIDHFGETWRDAEHEFQSKRLDAQRRNLLQAVQKFRRELSLNVFASGKGFLTMDMKDFEDRPKLLAKRDELNSLATTVFTEHQELVRLGRRFLSTEA